MRVKMHGAVQKVYGLGFVLHFCAGVKYMYTTEHNNGVLPHFTRTRIAPTPSGYLHMGNVLSFAVTATLAKQTGAVTLLRVDDMDRERVQPAYVQDIFDTLRFMDIPWQEGPENAAAFEAAWSQQYRMGLYTQALEQLRQMNAVYACGCSRAQLLAVNGIGCAGNCRQQQLPLDAAQVNWRLKTDNIREVTLRTLTGMRTEAFPAEMKDFVVRKKDGYPAYQLSSVIDDVHFGVDLIVRGKDLWQSTLAQLGLAAQLNAKDFTATCFVHHDLIKDASGEKLSKSAGTTSIQYLRKQGATAEALYNSIGKLLQAEAEIHNREGLGNAVLYG